MRKLAITLTLGSVLALAGCASAAPSAPPTLAQVASARHLTIVHEITPPTLYASHEATVTDGSRTWDLAVFANNTLRDNWIKIAGQFGAIAFKGNDYAAAG